MCGISGYLNFSEQPAKVETLERMIQKLTHRGPDNCQTYINKNFCLGHTRLSIIDLSDNGNQPMESLCTNYVVSFNGEIYNFKDLRMELKKLGYRFQSTSDTEVLLNSYIEWGKKSLTKFNGMFTFVIWDKKKRELFVARDRYGIKPLYYYIDKERIIFASEIKSILESKFFKSSLDKEGLIEYMTFQNFFTDKTLFSNIKTFKPGCYYTIKNNSLFKETQYWDFDFCEKNNLKKNEIIVQTEKLLDNAIKNQLVSDTPINSYLSGGIDSGYIATKAKSYLNNLCTFTIGFDLSSANGIELYYDERKKAERMSYLLGTEHYEMIVKSGDMQKCLTHFTYHLEEPRVGQSYPNYYAAKLASKFGKVVLSGIGGDEIFGGYPWRYFYTNKNLEFDQFVDNYFTKWQRLLPQKDLKLLFEPIKNDYKNFCAKEIFKKVLIKKQKKILTPTDCINLSMYFESKTFLPGLLIVEDKLSMSHSLETRVPFLDNKLVDFVLKIPSKMNLNKKFTNKIQENSLSQKKILRSRGGKLILREVFKKQLNDKVLQNDKQGFSSPDASWFRGESLKYVKNVVENDYKKYKDLINVNFLKKKVLEHLSGKNNYRLFIWSILYINEFLKCYFKRLASK